MLNLRAATEIPGVIRDAIDQLLITERVQRGVVEALDLPGLESDPRLAVWQGDITRLRIDAIVNAANSALLGCFSPLHRCIDNAIHSAAGPGLRAECAQIMAERQRLEPTGTATLTGGYCLPAGHVIHTVGPIVRGVPTREDQQLLSDCYRNCLRVADQAGLKSIALCAISTGEFGYPKRPAASIAVSTVREYLADETNLEKVIFNVFTNEDLGYYRELLGPDART